MDNYETKLNTLFEAQTCPVDLAILCRQMASEPGQATTAAAQASLLDIFDPATHPRFVLVPDAAEYPLLFTHLCQQHPTQGRFAPGDMSIVPTLTDYEANFKVLTGGKSLKFLCSQGFRCSAMPVLC